MYIMKKIVIMLLILVLGTFLFGCEALSDEFTIDAVVSDPVQERDKVTFYIEFVGDIDELDDAYIIFKDNDDNVIQTTNFEDIDLEGINTISADGLEAGESYFVKVYVSYSHSTRSSSSGRLVHHNVEDLAIGLGGVLMERFDLHPRFFDVPDSIVLEEGEALDLSDYDIVANHEVEGDLTSEITYSPIDTTILDPGTYTLTLYVSDSNGNESTVEIELIIN